MARKKLDRSDQGDLIVDDYLIDAAYLETLAPIYRDILRGFPVLEPHRGPRDGLAIQTLYAELRDRYKLSEIRAACEEMEKHAVVELRNDIFVHPTALGEKIISELTGESARSHVPPFPMPTSKRGV